MGKLTALIIIVFTAVWLGPMCARLPVDLSSVAAPVATVVPDPAPVAAPVATPAPVTTPASDTAAVVVIAYRMKKMFPITDDRGRVSVLMRNDSDRDAVGMRLTMNARKNGKIIEHDSVNSPFTVAAGSSTYRGLFVSVNFLDALFVVPPEPGVELQWALTYHLDGDAPDIKRCYNLRALPRTREPEGIIWTPLGSSTVCPPPAQ